VSAFRLAADDHLISRTFPPVLHHDYPQSVRKPAAALICPSADLHKRTPGSLRSRGFCKFVASAFETSVSGRPGCRGGCRLDRASISELDMGTLITQALVGYEMPFRMSLSLPLSFSTRPTASAAKVQSQARSRNESLISSVAASLAQFVHSRANCRYSLDVVMAAALRKGPGPAQINLEIGGVCSEVLTSVEKRCFSTGGDNAAQSVPFYTDFWPRIAQALKKGPKPKKDLLCHWTCL
jgi:hypothetical protein